MKTRDQQYAALVFEQVERVKARWPSTEPNKPSSEQKKYGSMAHNLPVLVRTAGLVQALAFVQARRQDDPHRQLLVDLAATVLNQGTTEDLLLRSRTTDLVAYMYLTLQVLDALLWYKRFAQSVLHVDTADAGVDQEVQVTA